MKKKCFFQNIINLSRGCAYLKCCEKWEVEAGIYEFSSLFSRNWRHHLPTHQRAQKVCVQDQRNTLKIRFVITGMPWYTYLKEILFYLDTRLIKSFMSLARILWNRNLQIIYVKLVFSLKIICMLQDLILALNFLIIVDFERNKKLKLDFFLFQIHFKLSNLIPAYIQ